ncbi:hypothetical protein [Nonomuraea rhizosphaerae]|uniref:hypothetical protein n=1 Tax=Nonomuraea rhizosphaerae TaxID=2665663 RepID=UPI001C5DDB1C|nr:hypothetical protein [Nonomuraea rhizosphaerae]
MEDSWIDEFAVAGDPDHVRRQLQRLLDSGADSLGLWLFLPDRLGDQLRRLRYDITRAAMPTSY